ncbi:BTAD domain-containing putative transcriptional regulator [Actinoplanes sp. NPDC051346]|uniref:AfsR/SARP family transcriptional regulator n=1 Tax=Actinoplanes sp. NPDC051346 TaxID=3155048 RepID=UPI00342E5601
MGGRRQCTTLAVLALTPNRVVSIDTLSEDIWQGRPPTTARTQIAICVAGIRKAFKEAGCDEELILTRQPGYILSIDESAIDVCRFDDGVLQARQLIRDNRPADAAALLTSSLALWHGPALDGISGYFVETEAAQIAERRLSAYELLTGLRLEMGEHRQLIGGLTAHVNEHPLRERARAHLMLAQYRSGHRVESLQTFHEGRSRSIDDFGIEPGPELQDLHLAILRDDPALLGNRSADPQPSSGTTPAQLPFDAPTILAREDALSQLDQLLDKSDTDDGELPAVGLVVGPPGVGKTSLAVQWARRSAARFPDGQLFAEVHRSHGSEGAVSLRTLLNRFLRDLGVAPDAVPHDPAEGLTMYRELLRRRRILLVFDGVEELSQVRPLLPGDGHSVVVMTARRGLHELDISHRTVRVGLQPLSDRDATTLLGTLAGVQRSAQEPVPLRRLAALCGRLPIALSVAGAKLASKPHWTVQNLMQRMVDPARRLDELSHGSLSVRDSFASAYEALDGNIARMCRRLAMLETEDFAAWPGAAMLDIDAVNAEDLIEELVDAQLLTVSRGSRPGRVRFRFPSLFRLYALERSRLEDDDERRDAYERFLTLWLALAREARQRCGLDGLRAVKSVTSSPMLDGNLVADQLRDPAAWLKRELPSIPALVRPAGALRLDALAASVVELAPAQGRGDVSTAAASVPRGGCQPPSLVEVGRTM